MKNGLHPEAAEKLINSNSRILRTLLTLNFMQKWVWRNLRDRIFTAFGQVFKLVKPNVGWIEAGQYDKAEKALEIYAISKRSW